MIQLLFFLLLVLTFFLAGMFSYLPLLVLFAAMLLLAVFCFITSRYFRRHLSVKFVRHSQAVQENCESSCDLLFSYTGSLPAGEARVYVSAAYGKGRKRRLTVVNKVMEKAGEEMVSFPVRAPYCGLVSVTFDRLIVCDYLTLFRPQKRQRDAMELAVFPEEKALQLELSKAEQERAIRPETQLVERKGDNSQEIRQLREYQEGDPVRNIHWNLSARMDDLWVKEFQRESDSQAYVLLDGRGFSARRRAEAGCFYELISALILGLLAHVSAVTLGFKEPGKEALELKEIGDADQCREALLVLYRNGLAQELPEASGQEGIFLVDPKLRIIRNGQVLHQFSQRTLSEELDREVLIL